jgi:hypothetical protein
MDHKLPAALISIQGPMKEYGYGRKSLPPDRVDVKAGSSQWD